MIPFSRDVPIFFTENWYNFLKLIKWTFIIEKTQKGIAFYKKL